jgi:hypothetical protein
MTSELTAKWETIATAWPHALQAIPRTTQPSDGQPTGTQINAPTPVNDTAQSWCAEVEQAAFGWAAQGNNANERIHWLTQNQPHTADLDASGRKAFTDITERLAQEALKWVPARTQTTQLQPNQLEGLYCATIQELAWALESLGKPTKLNTVKSWVQRGHLTQTPAGYSLAQAHTRASA